MTALIEIPVIHVGNAILIGLICFCSYLLYLAKKDDATGDVYFAIFVFIVTSVLILLGINGIVAIILE